MGRKSQVWLAHISELALPQSTLKAIRWCLKPVAKCWIAQDGGHTPFIPTSRASNPIKIPTIPTINLLFNPLLTHIKPHQRHLARGCSLHLTPNPKKLAPPRALGVPFRGLTPRRQGPGWKISAFCRTKTSKFWWFLTICPLVSSNMAGRSPS